MNDPKTSCHATLPTDPPRGGSEGGPPSAPQQEGSHWPCSVRVCSRGEGGHAGGGSACTRHTARVSTSFEGGGEGGEMGGVKGREAECVTCCTHLKVLCALLECPCMSFPRRFPSLCLTHRRLLSLPPSPFRIPFSVSLPVWARTAHTMLPAQCCSQAQCLRMQSLLPIPLLRRLQTLLLMWHQQKLR